MVRISVHAQELTDTECSVLSEILAAKLEQHIADRKAYLRPANAAIAARLAQDSGRAGILTSKEGDAPPRLQRDLASTGHVSLAGAAAEALDSGAGGSETPGNMVDAGTHRPGKPCTTLAPHLRDALRTVVEGLLMCQQPVRFCRLAMELSMGELFETREAKVYLTDKGREALR